LSKGQVRRADVLGRLSAGTISKDEAGTLLELSRRQVNRVLKEYDTLGIVSVVHGNIGRPPVNKTDGIVVDAVFLLAGENGKYHGFNVSHMADLLSYNEKIVISRPTLDRLLRAEKIINTGKCKNRVRRKRRERSSSEGMMLQIDGSPHDWLEGRAPRMSLVGAVDDATGKIVYAVFRPTEDMAGYLMMLRGITSTYGIPESIYHDRHTILRSPKPATIEDELAGIEPQSQFQRVMSELGIVSIAANSPQAKGRVERLWGTLQDRLTKEMRLAGISSIEDANTFLVDFISCYNKRFGKKAADPQDAWVEMDEMPDMAYYFCKRDIRKVREDHTISWFGKTLQIVPGSSERSLASKSVNVHVTPEDEVFIYDGKRRLEYKEIPVQAKAIQESKAVKKTVTLPSPESLAKKRAWLFSQPAA